MMPSPDLDLWIVRDAGSGGSLSVFGFIHNFCLAPKLAESSASAYQQSLLAHDLWAKLIEREGRRKLWPKGWVPLIVCQLLRFPRFPGEIFTGQ